MERSLVRSVTTKQIRAEYLADVDAAHFPPVQKRAIEEWIDGEIAKLKSAMRKGDEIWFYRYEKCPGCHWYRSGYVVMHGRCAIFDLNTRDEN
jgi:hypothetical protein